VPEADIQEFGSHQKKNPRALPGFAKIGRKQAMANFKARWVSLKEIAHANHATSLADRKQTFAATVGMFILRE
jgi:hypothetical protein